MEFTKKPNEIVIVRSLFLRGIAIVYLIANLSLYTQVQGLFGDEGLYPVKNFMMKLNETFKENSKFFNFPTLLHFSGSFNLLLTFFLPELRHFSPEENTFHFLCLLSILISLLITLNNKVFFNSIGFFVLWIIYLSFYITGQMFISQQWDLLLLESGFLAILFSPWRNSDLSNITFSQNTVYYLLRFLMFRITFSNGVGKILSGCQIWANFEAFKYFFQTTPLPHIYSYILHSSISYEIQKVIVGFIYILEIYVPFFFFNLVFRRLTVFAGILQFYIQFFYFISGNFNFYPFLAIIINLSNFDDDFILSVFPNFLLKRFDLDFDKITTFKKSEEEIIKEKREKLLGKKPTQVENNSKENEEENKIQEGQKDQEPFYKRSNLTNPFITELITFVNMLSILLLICFMYILPLNDILGGKYKIYPSIFLKNILNIQYFSYYILAVFFFIVLKFLFFNYEFFSEELNRLKYRRGSHKYLNISICFMRRFLFFILITVYFFSAVSSLYNTVKLKITDNVVQSAIQFSKQFTKRIHIANSYTLFKKIKGVSGRLELEFFYKQSKGEWIILETTFNRDLEVLKFPSISHSRLNWKLATSAYSQDINSQPYLALILGRLLERNPVTLNLLGFSTIVSETIRKHSLIYKIFPSFLTFPSDIEMFKIERYKLSFNSKEHFTKTGKYWSKRVFNSFLHPVKIDDLKEVFNYYELPLNKGREILISPFEFINVKEIVLFIISLYLVRKLFRKIE